MTQRTVQGPLQRQLRRFAEQGEERQLFLKNNKRKFPYFEGKLESIN